MSTNWNEDDATDRNPLEPDNVRGSLAAVVWGLTFAAMTVIAGLLYAIHRIGG